MTCNEVQLTPPLGVVVLLHEEVKWQSVQDPIGSDYQMPHRFQAIGSMTPDGAQQYFMERRALRLESGQ